MNHLIKCHINQTAEEYTSKNLKAIKFRGFLCVYTIRSNIFCKFPDTFLPVQEFASERVSELLEGISWKGSY